MKKFWVYSLMLLASSSYAYDPDYVLSVFCNSEKSAFVVTSEQNMTFKDTGMKKMSVNWQTLLVTGPQKDQYGDLMRTGTKTMDRQCGAITLRFTSGYVNTIMTTELGLLDFPVVEVLHGANVLLSKTGMYQCHKSISRYNYFGECPGKWAQTVEFSGLDQGVLKVTRMYSDDEKDDIKKEEIINLRK